MEPVTSRDESPARAGLELPPAPRAIRTASIANLGCKVNQSEMDAVERLLRARGIELVEPDRESDLVVINTCAVTTVADQKSRHAVRRARRTSPDAAAFVTGCSVQLDEPAFAAADPQARLLDNVAKERLVDEVAELLGGAARPPLTVLEPEAACERPDAGARIERTRAFIKVQDGCSFHCTYCIIPRLRGEERAVLPDRVVREVLDAVEAGHREVVLAGINIGTYDGGSSVAGPRGSHTWEALSLPGLIRRLLDETPVERIRLSSIEPQHVDDELLSVWMASGRRCLPHFHLPLQSGDDMILRRMGRRYTTEEYAQVVARVRGAVPGVAMHADLMVGFPGEDDESWARTLDFLRSLDLAGLHVFRYSARPGTPATRMIGQVDERTKKRRSAEALELAAGARARYAAGQLGGELRVLFESPLQDGQWLGHAENYVEVAAAAPAAARLENVIATVRAESVDPDSVERLAGSIVSIG